MKRIVLTGGPGAGKTVVSQRLAQQRPDRYIVVPEAATQVYALLNTRWDRLDLDGRYDAQRRIYRLQVEQEDRIAREHPNHILLLDRGTVDGAAYWPDGAEAYWLDLKTTVQRELLRYDAILWLETAAALGGGFYDGDSSNACRFEDAQGAIDSGKFLLHLWGGHANLKHVGAFTTLDDKIAAVAELLDAMNIAAKE